MPRRKGQAAKAVGTKDYDPQRMFAGAVKVKVEPQGKQQAISEAFSFDFNAALRAYGESLDKARAAFALSHGACMCINPSWKLKLLSDGRATLIILDKDKADFIRRGDFVAVVSDRVTKDKAAALQMYEVLAVAAPSPKGRAIGIEAQYANMKLREEIPLQGELRSRVLTFAELRAWAQANHEMLQSQADADETKAKAKGEDADEIESIGEPELRDVDYQAWEREYIDNAFND